MKKYIVFLLMFASVLPCRAQKYHDAMFQEAKGNVKSISFGDHVYEYGVDGSLARILVTDDNSKKYFEITRDGSMNISGISIYEDSAHLRLERKSVFKYQNGMISEETVSFRQDVIAHVKTFVYDNGLCTFHIHKNPGGGEYRYGFEDIQTDKYGNWISRKRYRIMPGGEKRLTGTMTRRITYWDTDSSSDIEGNTVDAASETGWQSLVGKKLSLTVYGISQNGKEVNRFNCGTGEYLMLYGNGVLYWNNRHDGNTSYSYRIDGNTLYITQTSGKATQDKWFELVRVKGNEIKTESNVGTYRYFRIEE